MKLPGHNVTGEFGAGHGKETQRPTASPQGPIGFLRGLGDAQLNSLSPLRAGLEGSAVALEGSPTQVAAASPARVLPWSECGAALAMLPSLDVTWTWPGMLNWPRNTLYCLNCRSCFTLNALCFNRLTLALGLADVALGGGLTRSSTGGFSSGSLNDGEGLLVVGRAGLDLNSLARVSSTETDLSSVAGSVA